MRLDHLVLCRHAADDWIIAGHDADGFWTMLSEGSPALHGFVAQVKRLQADHRGAGFTFSTHRHVDEVTAQPFVDDPGQAGLEAALPETTLHLLLPIGFAHRPDIWTGIARYWSSTNPLDPAAAGAGRLLSMGAGSQFVERTLPDQIADHFKDTRSIEKQMRTLSTELWVRPRWTAQSLLPDSFPDPRPVVNPGGAAAEAARRDKQQRINQIAAGAAQGKRETASATAAKAADAAWREKRIAGG